ncbi:hypothetical protein LCGC14_2335170 [marine sediment metagenome]|uniref:Resolvase HTH domain-containing protein n=1 Tax=marine sediment metagenome TaxID=412755 RepID=A0A0F9D150_9ZZZZ
MKKTCEIEVCNNKYYGLGYCNKHYAKYRKYGDPLAGKEIELHNMTNTPEYKTWRHMKDRCLNPKNKCYKDYGGRGIQICPEWRNSFLAFFKDMGPRLSNQSIDRIDNNLGYSKENCRWSSPKSQTRNQRSTVLNENIVAEIRELFAEGYTRKEISEKLDLKYDTVYRVLKKNPDGSWVFWKPVRKIKAL